MKHIQYQKEIYFPSTIEGLDKCLDIVSEITQKFVLDLDTSFCLHTVIVESVENAIIHGNRNNRDLNVRVFISIDSDEIFVEVEDNGDGFDLDSIPSPIESSVIQCEGGRGIFFIKSLSTSCVTLGKGNILRIKLKR